MGLVAWYPLNNDTNDYSGNGYHATNNATTTVTSGKTGSAYSFTGDATKRIYRDNFPQHPIIFSWVLWIYRTSNSPSSQHFISMGRDVSNFGINLRSTSAGTFNWLIGLSSQTITFDLLNKWTHLVVTSDGTTFRYYVNGELNTTKAYSTVDFQWATNGALVIGKMAYTYTNNSLYFPASANINDVRIYDHTLSVKEVKEIYKTKVLHYTFNEFQEPTTNLLTTTLATVTDLSANMTKTDLGNGRYEIVNDGTGSSNLRFYCNLGDLINGETYACSIGYQDLSGGTLNIDWCDVNVTDVIKGNRAYQIASRGTYDATYRFMDVSLSTGTRVVLFEPQVENKRYMTPYIPEGTSRTATVRDMSGYGYDSTEDTLYFPSWREDGLGGGAYHFDSERVLGPQVPITDRLTLAAWVKLDTIRESGFIQSDYYLSCSATGNLRAYWYSTSSQGYHQSPNVLPTEEWVHVAAVWTGTHCILYENGSEAFSATTTTPGRATVSYVAIGTEGDGFPSSSRHIDGSIADVRIYATGLSAEDILELSQTRAQLDDIGNLFLNKIDVNGFKPTLVDYSTWLSGGTDAVGWTRNGTVDENLIIIKENPINEADIVWSTPSNDITSDSDGGWNTSNFAVDNTKTYRFTCWIRRENAGTDDGTTYFGTHGYGSTNGLITLSNSSPNTNPYFRTDGSGLTNDNEWMLWVAYIIPFDAVSEEVYITDTKGIWNVQGTRESGSCTTYQFLSGTTTANFRSYLYYSIKVDERMYWYRPRVDVIDGNEPTIEELISCSEHRVLIDDSFEPIWDNKSIGSDGVGEFVNLSEVGIADGLIGFWKLNGDANDYSGNGYDGTPTSTSGLTITTGIKDLAYNFDGTTSNYITIPTDALTNIYDFTLSLWFNSSDIAKQINTAFHATISGGNDLATYIRPSGTSSIAILAGDYTFPFVFSSDVWYHLTIIRLNALIYIYVNGTLNISKACTSGVITIPPTGKILLGQEQDGVGVGFDPTQAMEGKLTDVRIYNRALTAEEVNILYKYGLTNTGMQLKSNGTLFVNKEINEGL